MIKDSGERTVLDNGFQRDMHAGKGRMDLLPWYGIMEVSKHCEEGSKKYGEHNIDKGCPLHSLLDSGARHLAKVIAGVDDGEDHLRAACWNLLWALNQRTTHPEMDDMPHGGDATVFGVPLKEAERILTMHRVEGLDAAKAFEDGFNSGVEMVRGELMRHDMPGAESIHISMKPHGGEVKMICD